MGALRCHHDIAKPTVAACPTDKREVEAGFEGVGFADVYSELFSGIRAAWMRARNDSGHGLSDF